MDFGLLMGKAIASLEKEVASLDPTDAAHSGIVAHSVLRYIGSIELRERRVQESIFRATLLSRDEFRP